VPEEHRPEWRDGKPTPKVAKAASVPASGEKVGKKSVPGTSAAAVP
jgi:hypothetical protein